MSLAREEEDGTKMTRSRTGQGEKEARKQETEKNEKNGNAYMYVATSFMYQSNDLHWSFSRKATRSAIASSVTNGSTNPVL